MIDETAATLALRARATGTTVCTTGLINDLSATALGFARASGSFITDGFVQGQEVAGTGFSAANNSVKIITGVTAGFLTISGGCAVQALSAGRSLVVGFPSKRAWENEKFDLQTAAGSIYVSEQFVPGTSALQTITAVGGTVEETGLYVLTLYGRAGSGVAGLRSYMNALKARFTPGTTITAGSSTLRVRGDTSTKTGQIIPMGNEWSYCTISIPWRAFSINAIAA